MRPGARSAYEGTTKEKEGEQRKDYGHVVSESPKSQSAAPGTHGTVILYSITSMYFATFVGLPLQMICVPSSSRSKL